VAGSRTCRPSGGGRPRRGERTGAAQSQLRGLDRAAVWGAEDACVVRAAVELGGEAVAQRERLLLAERGERYVRIPALDGDRLETGGLGCGRRDIRRALTVTDEDQLGRIHAAECTPGRSTATGASHSERCAQRTQRTANAAHSERSAQRTRRPHNHTRLRACETVGYEFTGDNSPVWTLPTGGEDLAIVRTECINQGAGGVASVRARLPHGPHL
jgi:hypothetical protein